MKNENPIKKYPQVKKRRLKNEKNSSKKTQKCTSNEGLKIEHKTKIQQNLKKLKKDGLKMHKMENEESNQFHSKQTIEMQKIIINKSELQNMIVIEMKTKP